MVSFVQEEQPTPGTETNPIHQRRESIYLKEGLPIKYLTFGTDGEAI